MSLEELVQQLINDGKGDAGRLKHILSTIKKGDSLYTSDEEYLEKLLAELRKTEKTEQVNENQEESESENTPSKQLTEIGLLRKEIHKLQDKNHVIEEHLRNQGNQKIRKGDAIGGVFLMAIGIMLVVGGGGMVIVSLCLGQSTGYGGTCRSDMMSFITGEVAFWIGMIPTIFGVRLIAKA